MHQEVDSIPNKREVYKHNKMRRAQSNNALIVQKIKKGKEINLFWISNQMNKDLIWISF